MYLYETLALVLHQKFINESQGLKEKNKKKTGLTYICDMMEAVGCEQTVLSRWFE